MLSHPQTVDVPLLLLANKQDHPESMSVQEIREHYEAWWRKGQEEVQEHDENGQGRARQERVASLNVMGISALEGYAYLHLIVTKGS